MRIGFQSNVCRAVVRDEHGRVIEERVQHNTVLTQGRANIHGNGIFGTGSITHACAVGSSSQAITAGTTQLNDEEARVVCGSRSFGASPYRTESMIAAFSPGDVGGKTLHTWGFSHSNSAGANINTAGVFEDAQNNPSPISVPGGASLTLEYEFGITGTFSGSGTLAVAGGGTYPIDWALSAGSGTPSSEALSSLMALDGTNLGWRIAAGRGTGAIDAPATVQADGATGLKVTASGALFTNTLEVDRMILRAQSAGGLGEVFWIEMTGAKPTYNNGDALTLGDLVISW